MQERRSLKVGIFMPNNSGSMSISTYKPDPDDWTFESNKKIAQAAEDNLTILDDKIAKINKTIEEINKISEKSIELKAIN